MSRFDTDETIEFRKKHQPQWGEGWRANSDLVNTHVKDTRIKDVFQSIREMRNSQNKQESNNDKLPERPLNVKARFPSGGTVAIRPGGMTSFTNRRKKEVN
jgi:hypothetical protein